MNRLRARLIPAAALAGALALAVPAVASASGAWVSTAPVGANKSCASPGYNSVQEAVTAVGPGATVHVCGGTYTEQVAITQPVKIKGQGPVNLVLPSAPAASATSCDTAAGLEPDQIDEISVCTAGKVTIDGVDIQALAPISTCGGGLYGIFVAGGAELTAARDGIDGASTTLAEYKGCQHGVAVEVGSARADEVGHATLKDDTITGYEKDGPTVAYTGSTMKVIDSSVTGEGPTPNIAQNGIEVAYGAKGTIRGSVVKANECDYPGVCTAADVEEQAVGVLFYGAAKGSSVSESTLSENDMGVYNGSTSATQPTSPEVRVVGNEIKDNRYEGVVLEQGDALLLGDQIIDSGEVGIDIVQSAGQAYANNSSANDMTIEGETLAAVGVATDNSPSDPMGHFTIKNSSISSNAAEVHDPSGNFTINTQNDS